jgi:hypothetical protein
MARLRYLTTVDLAPADHDLLAREMMNGTAMAAATFTALQAQLDNERLLDLIATIAIHVGIVRLLGSLAIDVEPEYQRYLDEFPLPA